MNDDQPVLDPTPLPDRPAQRWGGRAFGAGLAVLVACIFYFLLEANVRTTLHLQLGMLILLLGFLPGLLWARRGQADLPVFETFSFTFVNAYALPLLNGHQELALYADETITAAALGVALFQIVSIAVHELTRGRARRHPFWRDEAISDDVGCWLGYGMALNTVYVLTSTFTTLIPSSIGSVLRAVFFGIGIVCTFITSRRLGQGELSPGERALFLANLAIQCIGMTTTLFLVGAVSQLLLALVGYVSARGRIPFVVCALALALIAVLHNGKAPMRMKYWEAERITPTISQLPAYFSEWMRHGLTFETGDEHEPKMTGKLIDRTSLFHIMCLVASASPGQQPFLHGETYKDIPAQFVPRLFWPGKPTGHVSTTRLSVYYGLQSEEETQKTTIGFGVVSEAYANFGFWGLALIGGIVGFVAKKVRCWSAGSPLFSYGGLLVVILLAWSFQIEFTASIWLASFYQACVAVLAIPFVSKTFVQP